MHWNPAMVGNRSGQPLRHNRTDASFVYTHRTTWTGSPIFASTKWIQEMNPFSGTRNLFNLRLRPSTPSTKLTFIRSYSRRTRLTITSYGGTHLQNMDHGGVDHTRSQVVKTRQQVPSGQTTLRHTQPSHREGVVVDVTRIWHFYDDPAYVNIAVKGTNETVVDMIVKKDFSDPKDKKWSGGQPTHTKTFKMLMHSITAVPRTNATPSHPNWRLSSYRLGI